MITFVPVGGLANRMRAIHSAISLAENDEVRICWFKDKGLNSCFHQLFQPISLSNVKLKEANLWDKILLDRPRRKNFHFPKLYQTIWFDACLYEHQTYANHIDFKQWKLSYNSILPETSFPTDVLSSSKVTVHLCTDPSEQNKKLLLFPP